MGTVIEEETEEGPSPITLIGDQEDGQAFEYLADDPIQIDQSVWYEIKDADSKKTFYFNDVTRVTQWKRPENVTIIPINQRGVAIILGNGVIEKDYRNATSHLHNGKQDNHIYIGCEDHLYDTVRHTQQSVFQEKTPELYSTPLSEQDISPTTVKQYVF